MTTPNFADKTIWTGDNLDILRGMNSACVDLIYLDPPFNSNQNYAGPVGSKAAGAALDPLRPGRGLDGPDSRRAARHRPRAEDGGPDPRQGDAVLPHHDGGPADGNAPGFEGHRQHLPSLRPDGQPLLEAADGRGVWGGEFQE